MPTGVALFTVYMATNKLNGKRYIGVTGKGMHGRRRRHEENAAAGRSGVFYDAIRKYGPKAFVWTVLCTRRGKAEAYRREFLYIDALNPEYNMVPGGLCPSKDMSAPNCVAVMCLEDGEVFESAKEAAERYNSDISEVCKAARGEVRSVRGRHFVKAGISLSEDERLSLIQKIDVDFVVRRRRVETRKPPRRGVINGHDVKGRRAAGPQKRMRPIICLDDGRRFASVSDAARFYDVDSSALSELCRGKKFRQTVGGRKFRFADSV